ncbi:phosphoglycerate mutase [Mycolicibacterium celeriflavum]|uniref:Phosphoglycerate mutase n=1 Tax=Mycolicibacterium celeriflavum TaxID=1249101 RepID=A0A1X0C275_MYCCF|nr:histidine phosphatase family protein [Mycolicibacterium celeriflavum]MCV7238094.1 histidine phosphatase family protein [Mycolicibacterium celeriflavum]OBG12654.1 phosphoglycerate mutase [Mycolicibacterium celeriflavum]ORA51200.1 histidine phosphatase family protein [Mycolicibacterium celeriflavum]BBY45103.1 phosphoglycerate mutase [Mycolicibacterium celeriflavum]
MSGRLVLVRHGQSLANVQRRLDTRPPGAELTDLGRNQARSYAKGLTMPPAILAHSVAHRARQTAEEIAGALRLPPMELDGIHEVQVGDLEDRNDDEAIATFETVYQKWHQGDLDAPMPNGETGNDVLDRYVPAITQLRMRHLDDDAWHGDIVVVSHGAAIRLVSSVLAGVESSFVLDHHLGNTEAVVLAPITDGRWSCVRWGSMTPPFYPEPDVHPVEDALQSADPMG